MDKPTLLEITQDVLNDISSDEVLSINDTVESVQVAAIVKSTYLGLMSNRNWPHTRKLLQPLTDADTSSPTYITFSDNMKELIWIKYDDKELRFLQPDDFLRRCTKQTGSFVVVTDPSGVTLNIRNDVAPQHFTSFDDKTLVIDSYNASVEDSLKKAKFQGYAYVIPDWTHDDMFVPDLPLEAFPTLVNEVKSICALRLRQQPDQKAEQEASRQRRYMARKDWTISGGIKYPNYGRKSGRGPHDPTFRRG